MAFLRTDVCQFVYPMVQFEIPSALWGTCRVLPALGGVPIMGRGLTRRQREILTFVQRYADAHGYPPSVREIGQALGLTSSSTVHSHLSALGKKGYLRRDPSKPRALEVLRNEHEIPSK